MSATAKSKTVIAQGTPNQSFTLKGKLWARLNAFCEANNLDPKLMVDNAIAGVLESADDSEIMAYYYSTCRGKGYPRKEQGL